MEPIDGPAVVSIIAVIIMGRGLDHTGVINRGIRPLLRLAGASRRRTILLLSGTVAVISSFMQNIGAAALFLPVALRVARLASVKASQLLMPLGFAAILGRCSRISDAMIIESAFALADYTDRNYHAQGRIFPPINELREVSVAVATQVLRVALTPSLLVREPTAFSVLPDLVWA